MSDIPEWLVVGGEAAIICPDPRILSLVDVTITKVGKRDVVVSNGERFNVNRLRRSSSSTWGPSYELVDRNDPRIPELRAKAKDRACRAAAGLAYEKWRIDQSTANAEAVVVAFQRLTNLEK